MTSLGLTPVEVTAALTGAEFEVRRKVTPQPVWLEDRGDGPSWHWNGHAPGKSISTTWTDQKFKWRHELIVGFSPFTPGATLCGKETWLAARPGSYEPMEKYWIDWNQHYVCPVYKIDYRFGSDDYDGHWRSAATMPRWASRLALEVLAVRCEQQDGAWGWGARLRRKG